MVEGEGPVSQMDDGRYVMRSLGAVVLVHDRRYAQNHVLDVLAAAILRLDPEGRCGAEELAERLSRGLSLAPGMLRPERLHATSARLRALGLIGLRTCVPPDEVARTQGRGGR